MATVATGEFRDYFVYFVETVYIASHLSPSISVSSINSVLTVSYDVYKQVHDVNWMELFCSTGMPRYVLDYSNSLSSTAVALAHMWIDESHLSGLNASKDDIKGWSSQQLQIFLEEFLNHPLPAGESFSPQLLKNLDAIYGFTNSQNSEIMFRWQMLCLRSNMVSILPHIVRFITRQGRMKYVRPLYRALGMSKIGCELAMDAFQQFKDTYHPIARKMLAADLNKIAALWEDDEEEEEGGKRVASFIHNSVCIMN
ncbi:hypothetical protein EON65_35185 [archaeon]|nr:MAG: hypothetical protein EON65_35185 [archaeon]